MNLFHFFTSFVRFVDTIFENQILRNRFVASSHRRKMFGDFIISFRAWQLLRSMPSHSTTTTIAHMHGNIIRIESRAHDVNCTFSVRLLLLGRGSILEKWRQNVFLCENCEKSCVRQLCAYVAADDCDFISLSPSTKKKKLMDWRYALHEFPLFSTIPSTSFSRTVSSFDCCAAMRHATNMYTISDVINLQTSIIA